MIIGAIGSILCVVGLKLLEKVKLDDVVGAVPAHLFAGIWGTLAASIAAGATFHIQLLRRGRDWSVRLPESPSYCGSWLDKMLQGVRVSPQVERLGQDAGELGMESYPEFVLMPEPDDED